MTDSISDPSLLESSYPDDTYFQCPLCDENSVRKNAYPKTLRGGVVASATNFKNRFDILEKSTGVCVCVYVYFFTDTNSITILVIIKMFTPCYNKRQNYHRLALSRDLTT